MGCYMVQGEGEEEEGVVEGEAYSTRADGGVLSR